MSVRAPDQAINGPAPPLGPAAAAPSATDQEELRQKLRTALETTREVQHAADAMRPRWPLPEIP